MEQPLLWELTKPTREAVTRAAIDDPDGKDFQLIISLLTPKFCTAGSETLQFTIKKGNPFFFFACCSSPFEKWNLLYPTGCQMKGTIKRLQHKAG